MMVTRRVPVNCFVTTKTTTPRAIDPVTGVTTRGHCNDAPNYFGQLTGDKSQFATELTEDTEDTEQEKPNCFYSVTSVSSVANK